MNTTDCEFNRTITDEQEYTVTITVNNLVGSSQPTTVTFGKFFVYACSLFMPFDSHCFEHHSAVQTAVCFNVLLRQLYLKELHLLLFLCWEEAANIATCEIH